jgi:putative ABC transport system substrate-binding protein
MKRRALLVGAAVLVAAPRLSESQHSGRVPRVAFVAMGRHPAFDVFAEEIRQLGYRDGETVLLEPRFAQPGRAEQFDALMAELLRTKVDIIVALINPEIAAARKATSTVPIVMVVGVNPVQQGFVASLAHPGGNVTGLTWDPDPEIYAKVVEFVDAAVPRLDKIAALVDPIFPATSPYWDAAVRAAGQRRIQLLRLAVSGPNDVEAAIAETRRGNVRAAVVFGGSMLFGLRAQLARLALQNGIAFGFPYREATEAGGLLSYGPNLPDLWRRSAMYVHRILQGAKPRDLPVEQPRKLDLVINLRTAAALGLSIPSSLLLRADHVIE